MRLKVMLIPVLTAPLFLAGCAQFPALDRVTGPVPQNLPYPTLLPYDQLAQPGTAVRPTDPAADLTGAAAALRRRAAAQQARV